MKQVNNDSSNIEYTSEITVFILFKSLNWTLSKNNNGIGFHIWKLNGNTSLHMSRRFMEVFLKFQGSWWWQLQYGKYLRNLVCQASIEHCLKIMMKLDFPYQNWGKPLYCTCQTHFWKYFYNFTQVDNDSCNLENTLEIIVLILLKSFHWTLPSIMMELDFPYQNWKGKTLLHMSNRFLVVFIKIQTSWQWQVAVWKKYGNHCFTMFDNLPLNIAKKCWCILDCPY